MRPITPPFDVVKQPVQFVDCHFVNAPQPPPLNAPSSTGCCAPYYALETAHDAPDPKAKDAATDEQMMTQLYV
jgi:hypothetical protein